MTRAFRAPKRIAQHPAVEECISGEAGGSDYKYDVWLREGCAFTRGRMAGCRGGFFNSVAEFTQARAARTAVYDADGRFVRWEAPNA